MRMVDIEAFLEDQLSDIDSSVTNLLHEWGYAEGDRLNERALGPIHDSLRRISGETPATFADARNDLVLGIAAFIAEFGLPLDDAERTLIDVADSYLGKREGDTLVPLEALFELALELWSAEQ